MTIRSPTTQKDDKPKKAQTREEMSTAANDLLRKYVRRPKWILPLGERCTGERGLRPPVLLLRGSIHEGSTRPVKRETPDFELPEGWSNRTLAGLRSKLLNWFDKHQRELPWRVTNSDGTRDAYHVWLSEVMLQQTTVAAVVPYFERFIAALPGVRALASADEQQVLKLWEGLGYYRRARHLHAAAKLLVEKHGGELPDNPDVGSVAGRRAVHSRRGVVSGVRPVLADCRSE